MKTMTDKAWELLIAEATAEELTGRLGQIYDAIEYKRTIEQALSRNWMPQN